jgi:chemotaxis signal transduction protein
VVVFREDFIRDHGEAVQECVDLLIEAGRMIREDVDKAAQVAVSFLDPKKELGLRKGLLKSVLSDPKGIRTDDLYPVKGDLETIQDYMVGKMGVGRTIDLDTFVETRFADATAGPGDSRAAETGAAAGTGAAALAVSETTRSREGKYLIFNLGDERYGIGILDVREIIGMMSITKMPQMPDAFKGVINLRGKVIPVLDMRVKFGMEEVEYTPRTCIIITEVSGLSGSTLVGGIVDSVSEVFQIKEADVEDSPNFGGNFSDDFILGMAKTEKGVIILLEIDRILQARDVVQLAEAV